MTIAGDVSSFGDSQRAELTASFASTLGCYVPACYIALRLSGSSVDVTVILTIPDAPPTGGSTTPPPSTTVTAVTAAATALVAQPASAISSSLGVTVEATSSVSVASAVMPIVLTSSPTTPPSSPEPSPPRTTEPSPPGLSPFAPAAALMNADGDGMPIGAIVGIVVAGVIGAIAIMGFCIYRYMRTTQKPTGGVAFTNVVEMAGATSAISSTTHEIKDGHEMKGESSI